MSDLVQIENPACGWMQNCNCSPAAMFNQNAPGRANYAERLYLYNESPSPASHQRAEMVTDLLDSATRVTAEQAIAIAFSTQVWRAETWQARVEQAWKRSGAGAKAADSKQVYELIHGWDHRSDPDSRGALAYYAFKRALVKDLGERIEPPAGLTDAQVIEALDKAAGWLKSRFGELAVPFGRYFRVGRRGSDRSWPVGGGALHEAGMATPRAIGFEPSHDGKSMIGHSGQSATQVVIMTDPPESYAILPLGESDHKESGHWDDQAEKLFSKGKALPTYFLRPEELMRHVTSTKVLNPPRP
jgi:acyl-homoserine lactone acylase PvdQ